MPLRPLLRVALLAAALLAGCAAPPPAVSPPPPATEAVTPLPLRPLVMVTEAAPDLVLAEQLLSHYLHGPYYRMSLPLMLSQQYQPVHAEHSTDTRRLMLLYRQGDVWGSLAVTAGRGSILNAFRIERNGTAEYALVLKRFRICLNAGADGAPQWHHGRWEFSSTRPGRFECSGRTNGSLFQPGSQIPGVLGPYAEDGDTVLYSRDWDTLGHLASLLAHRFPHMNVPHIE